MNRAESEGLSDGSDGAPGVRRTGLSGGSEADYSMLGGMSGDRPAHYPQDQSSAAPLGGDNPYYSNPQLDAQAENNYRNINFAMDALQIARAARNPIAMQHALNELFDTIDTIYDNHLNGAQLQAQNAINMQRDIHAFRVENTAANRQLASQQTMAAYAAGAGRQFTNQYYQDNQQLTQGQYGAIGGLLASMDADHAAQGARNHVAGIEQNFLQRWNDALQDPVAQQALLEVSQRRAAQRAAQRAEREQEASAQSPQRRQRGGPRMG